MVRLDNGAVTSGSGSYSLIDAAGDDASLIDVIAYYDALIAAPTADSEADVETVAEQLRREFAHLSDSNAWALLTPDGIRVPVLMPVFLVGGTVRWACAVQAEESWWRPKAPIETVWAEAARSYLELLECGRIDEAETRSLAVMLEFMLCRMEVPDEYWTEHCWCDGVIIETAVARERQVLEIHGDALWGPGGADFIDPLFVSIQLTEDCRALSRIEFKLGDANRRRPPGYQSKYSQTGPPAEWRSWFVFEPDNSPDSPDLNRDSGDWSADG